MPHSFRITHPHDGDVLTRHDGTESDSSLLVKVQGIAPQGREVLVNGIAASRQAESFACDVPLSARRNSIVAETEGMRDGIDVVWVRDSRKRFRFSIDDNILFLKDLGTNPSAYASLFDHWYLAFWRDVHQTFGTKVHMNIYYQTDEFDLTQMPDKWRPEWQDNADWLHLSFHALQDKPDRPYRHAKYPQIAHDYDLVCGHIRRFAGDEVLTNTTTVHWAECPKDAVPALRQRGIQNLVALFDVQGYQGDCTTGYYLSTEQCAYCDTRGAWYDRDTDLIFVRCTSVVNAVDLDTIDEHLDRRTNTPYTAEMVELLIHEQYFRKELHYYQPAVQDKVLRALTWVTERGYAPVFWSDGFLGTV